MRKKRNTTREFIPDVKFESIAITRFINYVMKRGKKSVAEKIVYGALEEAGKQLKKEPLEVFNQAMENAAPTVEVSSRRVGGANYQVPREVRPERKFVLASRWILEAARGKKGSDMAKRLGDEFVAAYKNEGSAIKKKLDVHRMAEANRAFAHFSLR